mgnify:CR=1 FL=1
MIKPTRLLLPLLMAVASLQVACNHRASGISEYTAGPDTPPRAVIKDGVAITLRDQKLTVIRDGKKVKDYDISTSKFGIGATNGSHRTPTGVHAVTRKVGEGQPRGMVFKGCRPTGEVVGVNAPGRDPIVTRVIQLAGLESGNRNSHSRRIYIHGTPEERNIGRPASYGCIRMRSTDVMDLYPRVHRGMPVVIERCSQDMYLRSENNASFPRFKISPDAVAALPTESSGRTVAKRSYARGKKSLRTSRRAMAYQKKRAVSKKLKRTTRRKELRRSLRKRG